MKYIALFETWTQLNENTAAAMQYVFKRAAKKDGDQLTDEQKKEALEKPAIKKIFELTKSHPNYALPFLRFWFEHKAPLESPADNPDAPSLEYLVSIIKNKKQMLAQLEHNFDYYASLKPEENGRTGFERLTDELRTLERAKDAKWFIDALPRTLRDQYRSSTKDEQARVINLAVQLKDLGKTVIDRIFKKIKAFTNWNLTKVIEYIEDTVKGYSNLGISQKIAEIEALEPEAGVIYSDNQYLVLSVRTEKAQKDLCSIANWCINRGSFEGYANNAVQLNIFNFGISQTNPLFLTGTTIYYNGEVRTSHDINDAYIRKSEKLSEHLSKLGYPKKLIDAVDEQFYTEAAIKKIIFDLKIDKRSIEELLFFIIKESYLIDPTTDPMVLNIILDIVQERIKNKMTRQQVVSFYVKYGVLSKFSAQLLKILLEDASKTEAQTILTATLQIFKIIRKTSENIISKSPQLKNIISQEKEILQELESMS